LIELFICFSVSTITSTIQNEFKEGILECPLQSTINAGGLGESRRKMLEEGTESEYSLTAAICDL
jgi:hypothetical protein